MQMHIDFLRSLPKSKIERVYFFVGEEDYLIDTAIKRIIEKFKGGVDVKVFYGEELSLDELLKEAEGGDLFGQNRPKLIVIKHVHWVKKWKELLEKVARLKAYVVMVSESLELLSKKWFKSMFPMRPKALERSLKALLPKSSEIVYFPILKKDDPMFKKWLHRELKKRNLILTSEALTTFLERIPEKLRVIVSEMDKLAAYHDETGELITPELIRTMVHSEEESEAFGIGNALISMQAKELLREVDLLLEEKVYPTYIMGAAASAVDRALKLKAGKAKRMPRQIAQIYKKFVRSTRAYDMMRIFDKLLEADAALKSTVRNAAIAVKLAFLEYILEIKRNGNG